MAGKRKELTVRLVGLVTWTATPPDAPIGGKDKCVPTGKGKIKVSPHVRRSEAFPHANPCWGLRISGEFFY